MFSRVDFIEDLDLLLPYIHFDTFERNHPQLSHSKANLLCIRKPHHFNMVAVHSHHIAHNTLYRLMDINMVWRFAKRWVCLQVNGQAV